jgi:hypothetical protein
MADVHRLTVRLASATFTLLQQFCQERECTMSDACEAATLAYLTPRPDGMPSEALGARVEDLHQKVDALLRLVETLVPTPQQEPEPLKIASYDDLYTQGGATPTLSDVQAADVLPALPPPRGWRRWLMKEV